MHRHRLVCCGALLAALVAIAPTSLPAQTGDPLHDPSDLGQVVKPLPSGLVTPPAGAIAIGRYTPDHPGNGVASLHGGALWYSFQPHVLEHIVPTVFTAVTTIATIPGGGGVDELAVVDPDGLGIASYGPFGFVPHATVTPLPSWVGCQRLRVRRFVDPASGDDIVLFLGADASGTLHLASRTESGPLVAVSSTPLGTALLDFDWIDWIPGGTPEVAVLTTTALIISDTAGTPIASHPLPLQSGFVRSADSSAGEVLLGIATGATPHDRFPFLAGPALGVVANTIPNHIDDPLIGIDAGDLDRDGFPEIVVSTTAAERLILRGSEIGITGQATLEVVPDAPSLPLGTANSSAALVHDIDHDGAAEIVYSSEPANALVTILEPAPLALAATEDPDPADEGQYFELLDGLGIDSDHDFSIESGNGFEETTAAGLRIRLPAEVEAVAGQTMIQAITWVVEDPNALPGTKIEPVAAGNYLWALPEEIVPEPTGAIVDLGIPFYDHFSDPTSGLWPDGQRYWVELRLVEYSEDGQPIALAPATWSAFGVKTYATQGHRNLVASLIGPLSVVYLCSEAGPWDPVTPPQTPACNRYLGVHVPHPPEGFAEAFPDLPGLQFPHTLKAGN